MTPYTPPEPVQIDKHIPSGYVIRGYTEAQLRSEVERIRRETIEECARIAEQYEETSIGHTAIRELLK